MARQGESRGTLQGGGMAHGTGTGVGEREPGVGDPQEISLVPGVDFGREIKKGDGRNIRSAAWTSIFLELHA